MEPETPLRALTVASRGVVELSTNAPFVVPITVPSNAAGAMTIAEIHAAIWVS